MVVRHAPLQRASQINEYVTLLYCWNFPPAVGVTLDSLYFFLATSASNEWMSILYTTATWFAVSFEWTAESAKLLWFTGAVGTLSEPPKRSKWVSWENAARIGPCSHFMLQDATRALRAGVTVVPVVSVGLPSEYCTMVCSPPRIVGEVKSMAFARRRLKLEDELVPKDPFCSTLGADTKLPLFTPRNPSTLAFLLNGVSMLPSLIVPQSL